jgi:hypothetical protein
MALTLNRLNREIATFKTNHAQLNTWLFGDPWEKNAKINIEYPMLFGMVKPSPIQGTSETFVIEFFVCDKPGVNKRGEIEALSDTKQIANDLLSYLAGEDFTDDLQIDKDETIQLSPFVESFDNNVCGWSFEVPIKIPFEWDLCSVPYTGSPATASDGAATIYDQNNNLQYTLYPGDMLILNDLTFVTEDYTVTGTTQSVAQTPVAIFGVYMNGQKLTITSDYTISGTTITFVNAMANDLISIVYAY